MSFANKFVTFFAALAMVSIASAEPPVILDVSPRAIAPGMTQALSIRGKNLNDATQLWTSFPSRCRLDIPPPEQAKDPASWNCQLTAARDEQVGIAAIRLSTSEGVSDYHLVMIDDLVSCPEIGGNDQLQTGQVIAWPIAIDGTADALKSDHYRFAVEANTELSFEVVAQRTGSPLDAVLTLWDEHGNRLLVCDDDLSVGADARFRFLFRQAGTYILGLRDVQYRGGSGYRYRLRIGRFPLVSNTYPLGGALDSIVDFQFLDYSGSPLTTQNILLGRSSHENAGQRFMGLLLPDQDASGFTAVALSRALESLEREPNDSFVQATPLCIPSVTNGRIEHAKDVDYFALTPNKAQRLMVCAESKCYGSPAELMLRLWNDAGVELAQGMSDASHPARIEYSFPEAGKYCLSVEELLGAGGNQYAYRLGLKDSDPGFVLSTEMETVNAPQGGSFVIKIVAQRTSYQGPIELSVGLSDGNSPAWPSPPHKMLAEGQNEVEFEVILPASFHTGQMHLVQFTGRAQVDEESTQVQVSTLPALLAKTADAIHAPRFLDGRIAIGITAPVTAQGEENGIDNQAASLEGK